MVWTFLLKSKKSRPENPERERGSHCSHLLSCVSDEVPPDNSIEKPLEVLKPWSVEQFDYRRIVSGSTARILRRDLLTPRCIDFNACCKTSNSSGSLYALHHIDHVDYSDDCSSSSYSKGNKGKYFNSKLWFFHVRQNLETCLTSIEVRRFI
jgi:hypothetical protein